MKHQEIKGDPLTEEERASLTDDERTLLAAFVVLDPEARSVLTTAFFLAMRAETDAEAEQLLADFKEWQATRAAPVGGEV